MQQQTKLKSIKELQRIFAEDNKRIYDEQTGRQCTSSLLFNAKKNFHDYEISYIGNADITCSFDEIENYIIEQCKDYDFLNKNWKQLSLLYPSDVDRKFVLKITKV